MSYEGEESIVKELLTGIDVLDRAAFKEVIHSVTIAKDEESVVLATLLYENFNKLYSATKSEQNEWYELIQIIGDPSQRSEMFSKYFSSLLPDNKDTSFILKYLNFLQADSKLVWESEVILHELVIYSIDRDFLHSQELFQCGLQAIEASDLDPSQRHQQIKLQYLKRLQIKHKQIDQTFQDYSKFVSQSFQDNYESELSQANALYQRTKDEQLDWEVAFVRENKEDASTFWLRVLGFCYTIPKSKRNIDDLVTIFENAIAEFDDIEVWQKFLILFDEYSERNDNDDQILPYLSRYLKRYPYSPKPYIEIFRGIPTRFSQNIYASIYPRFEFFSNNHEIDFEDWKNLSISHIRLLFEFKDPTRDAFLEKYFKKALDTDDNTFHSVERSIVGCLEKQNNIEKARNYLRLLTTRYENQSEGWLISYYFERRNGDRDSALRVLTAAVNRAEKLDWADRIFEEYLRFGELYHEHYKTIVIRINKKKRHIEELIQPEVDYIIPQNDENSKRKHEDSISTNEIEDISKKRRTTAPRNREQLTVSVSNIPSHLTLKQVLSFFKDCGEILESKLISSNEVNQAHLEFTNENDVLRALTKDYKRLGGSELRVQRLLNSTVWITNFPPTFTQVDLEKTFSTVGQVISVRLPSLKFNVQRRFCYIEFADSASAAAAVEKFDGEVINGFKLNVKISDPSSKQNRSGAAEEGREVYVSKLDFYKVTAAKVKELFGKYGIVQNVHLPLSESNKMQGKKHDGYGFVVFSTPAEAQNALSLNLISFEGRAIEVSISKKKSQKEKNKEKTAFKDYRYADNVLALKNLPDTINGDQLKSFFTKYGEVDDVVLEPRFRGALIILSNANEAGSISMKIEGKKIGDYNIELTTVSDLQRSEQPNGSNVSNATKKTSFIPSSLRRKPKVSSIQSNQPVTASGAHSSSPEPVNQIQKTNDDFRAMLLGKK